MNRKDERTEDQKVTHTLAVVGRDSFMSGWGGAEGGYSRAAWAFNPIETPWERVYDRIHARSDMRYVNLVDLRTYRPARGTANFHIYVWQD